MLVLTLEEGEPTRVGRVTLTGSLGLPLPQLLAALGMDVGWCSTGPGWTQAWSGCAPRCAHQRYYRARVGAPLVTLEEGRATVAVPVSAGPRYSFHFHGNHRFPPAHSGAGAGL